MLSFFRRMRKQLSDDNPPANRQVRNPDVPEEWEYIKKYSPYQNVKKGMDYPEIYISTSTRDDRVHPGHARKMLAKMNDMGYKVYYYENTEGGHAGSSTNEQRAKSSALMFSYLLMKLK